jgi:hypothetical protein
MRKAQLVGLVSVLPTSTEGLEHGRYLVDGKGFELTLDENFGGIDRGGKKQNTG